MPRNNLVEELNDDPQYNIRMADVLFNERADIEAWQEAEREQRQLLEEQLAQVGNPPLINPILEEPREPIHMGQAGPGRNHQVINLNLAEGIIFGDPAANVHREPQVPRDNLNNNPQGFQQMVREAAQRAVINNILQPNRRGAALVVDDGRHIPRNIVEQQDPLPEIRRMPAVKKAQPMKPKMADKKAEYPEDGIVHSSGHRFARYLTGSEDSYLRNYGYFDLIRKYKDLEWKEKEKPVNVDEEVIVTISELADYYAMEECKSSIVSFDMKEHNKEYQTSYKRHVKTIASFKRNRNG